MRNFQAAILSAAVLVTLFLAGLTAQAITVPKPAGMIQAPVSPVSQISDVQYIICSLLLWVFWLLLIFSVIMFLVGGYRYAVSAGDPEKVKNAGRTLLYAVIAIVIALCVWGIPSLIDSFLGGANYFTLWSLC